MKRVEVSQILLLRRVRAEDVEHVRAEYRRFGFVLSAVQETALEG